MVKEQSFYISDHVCGDHRCKTVYTAEELKSDQRLQQHFKQNEGKLRRIKFREWNFDIESSTTFHAFFEGIIQFYRWTPRYILQDNGFRMKARIELGTKPPSLVLTANDKALILNKLVAMGYSIAGYNNEKQRQEQQDGCLLLIYRTHSQFPYRWNIVEAWSIGTYHTDKGEHRRAIMEKYLGVVEKYLSNKGDSSYD